VTMAYIWAIHRHKTCDLRKLITCVIGTNSKFTHCLRDEPFFSKSCPATRHAGAKVERKYSLYAFFTSAPNGVSGQRHALAALYPVGRTCGTHRTGGWVGPRAGLDTEEKSFASAEDRTPVVQSVVRHYTDEATPIS
jgi:hypothetical protein